MGKSPIEPAPKFHELLVDNHDDLPRLIQISQEIEDPYLHWSQIKYKKAPLGLSHHHWWLTLILKRSGNYRKLPFNSTNGEPFVFNLTDSLYRSCETLSRELGSSIQHAELNLPDASRTKYIVAQLIEEAITSSQLEGATTSRKVAKEMLSTGRAPKNKSELMIFNNYRAMEFVSARKDQNLTPEFFLELHELISEDTLEFPEDAGQLQQLGDERVAIFHNEHIVHHPPHADQLPERLTKLCDFANEQPENGTYIPEIARAIILHFMIGYDHYFADGNGRTARAVFLWYMLKKGFTLMEFVSISTVLKNSPSQYIRAYLFSEDDSNDVTYFIHYQLEVLKKSVDRLYKHIRKKGNEKRIFEEELELKHKGLNHRQIAMAKELYENPDYSVSAYTFADRYRISPQTVRNDLESLVTEGLLARSKQGRTHVWKIIPKLT